MTTETTERAFSPRDGRLDSEAAVAYVAELFVKQGRMVLGLCRLLLRDPTEAEDAAQQVFLSAHQALLRGSVPRDPAAWTAAIARNECRARIRARMREPLGLPELPSDLPDPLASAIRAADLHAVWAALATLPRRQRRALVLRELGGLSYHELGRALGVSHSAVQSLLFRARQQVRSLVAGANAAALPVAVRDELARLIPGFDPGTTGVVGRLATLPIAWKVASAAVGVGVVATGAGGLHSRPGVSQQHEQASAAPVHVRAESPEPSPARARVQRVILTQQVSSQQRPGRTEARKHETHGQETEARPAAPQKGQEREPADESSSAGPGPAPAEVAAVEASAESSAPEEPTEDHSGPGALGTDDSAPERSGSGEGSEPDDSGHSGPG